METEEDLFRVEDSPIEGKGGFALRDIEKGETICVMKGESRTFAYFEEIHRAGNSRISCDQLQIGVRTYIATERPYVYLNHSCDPNAGIRGERAMTALRNISRGEEITYDYSATEWTVQDYPPYYTDGWPMDCNCRSSVCRKRVGCFPYLPKSLQEKYVHSGVIQDHILERLKEPEESQRCYVCEKELLSGV